MEHRVFFAFLALTLIHLLIGGKDRLVGAAPSSDDLAKFGEMERTIKELTSSILAMSGASSGRFNYI
ncbi:hypothetical protein KR032_010386 [Drosophila birchii]|nr:hypothetical protein KR032_010386 [Drosophila birchii]